VTEAAATFDAQAGGYDAARRRLIPPFDAFYGTAVEAIGLAGDPRHILDLGAGTGLLSAHVRRAYPNAALTLLDGAARMLAQARAQLGGENIAYLEGTLEGPLPEGPWDAVVSALAIHHLGDPDKRSLMQRIQHALRPGGVFVNAEQVAGPTERFSCLYASWHESRSRAAGSDDREWAAAVERMTHDRCASVEDQLRWLREAGFAEADCLFKHYRFAVMVAMR
jgi:tRNA (cmo5U34)-methyltransferase